MVRLDPVDVWPGLWGGYSQYMYVHPNAVVHKMPSHIPAAHAAAFLPFSNGVEWAYEYGEVGLGDAILIQGPGQQGLACVIAAKAAGASQIIVSGLARDAQRLKVAEKLGATHTIDVEIGRPREPKVKEITGGEGVNVVVNVTGGGDHGGGCHRRGFEAVQYRPRSCGQRDYRCRHAGPAQDRHQAGERPLLQVGGAGDPVPRLRQACRWRTSPRIRSASSQALEAIDAVAGKGAPGAIHVSIVP